MNIDLLEIMINQPIDIDALTKDQLLSLAGMSAWFRVIGDGAVDGLAEHYMYLRKVIVNGRIGLCADKDRNFLADFQYSTNFAMPIFVYCRVALNIVKTTDYGTDPYTIIRLETKEVNMELPNDI